MKKEKRYSKAIEKFQNERHELVHYLIRNCYESKHLQFVEGQFEALENVSEEEFGEMLNRIIDGLFYEVVEFEKIETHHFYTKSSVDKILDVLKNLFYSMKQIYYIYTDNIWKREEC